MITGMMISISNITANCSLNKFFDIDKLVEQHAFCHAVRNRNKNKKFHSVKVDCVFASALLFRNGNVVFVGGNTIENVYLARDVLCNFFEVYPEPPLNFSNFCSTVNFGKRLNNDYLYIKLDKFSDTKSIIFEKELFPPIRWQHKSFTSTINIFDSGKINSTGNRTLESAVESLKTTVETISAFGNACIRESAHQILD